MSRFFRRILLQHDPQNECWTKLRFWKTECRAPRTHSDGKSMELTCVSCLQLDFWTPQSGTLAHHGRSQWSRTPGTGVNAIYAGLIKLGVSCRAACCPPVRQLSFCKTPHTTASFRPCRVACRHRMCLWPAQHLARIHNMTFAFCVLALRPCFRLSRRRLRVLFSHDGTRPCQQLQVDSVSGKCKISMRLFDMEFKKSRGCACGPPLCLRKGLQCVEPFSAGLRHSD